MRDRRARSTCALAWPPTHTRTTLATRGRRTSPATVNSAYDQPRVTGVRRRGDVRARDRGDRRLVRRRLRLTDERCVAPDHEFSNFRMADEALARAARRRGPPDEGRAGADQGRPTTSARRTRRAGLRADPARARSRRPHVLALPGRRRGRRARLSSSGAGASDARDGAACVPHHAYASGGGLRRIVFLVTVRTRRMRWRARSPSMPTRRCPHRWSTGR